MDTQVNEIPEETKAPPPLDESVPLFRVEQAPGFMTGREVYPVGSVVPWIVPDDWNEKRHGKHWASYGPSITMTPMNAAAEDLMAKHKETVKRKNVPASSEVEELKKVVAKQSDQISQLMAGLLAQQAEDRRRRDAEAAEDRKSKK